MKDRSLVAFTLLSQMAVGAFWTLGALHFWATWQTGTTAADALTGRAMLAVGPIMVVGMLASFFHLGKPFSAWQALANLASSWLSREILFVVLFTSASGLFAWLQWFKLGMFIVRVTIAWTAALLGLALIYSMANAYRLRTVPAWDTWITPLSFFTTAFLLGGLAVGGTTMINSDAPPELTRSAQQWIALGAIVLMGAQLVVTMLWVSRLATGPEAAASAAHKITQEHRLIFRLRLTLTALGILAAGIVLSPWERIDLATIGALGLTLASEVLGRLLFYEARVRHGI